MNAIMGRYLKTRELARQLGVSVSAVKVYTQRGVLRFRRKSKKTYQVFIPRDARYDSGLLRRLKALGCNSEHIRSGKLSSVVSRVNLERAVSNFQKRSFSRESLKVGSPP